MSRKDQQQSLLSHRPAPTIVRNGNDGERAPFLAEPVRLTPAWEANNLPNDELNFKGMTMERAKMEINPPYDRYKIVFFIFMLHGIGTLTAWNMFITPKQYFTDFKLHENYTGVNSTYKESFIYYIPFAAQFPNLIFNWLNVFVRMGGNLTTRIIWSLLIEVIIFVFTVILAMINSSTWPEAFFWLTALSVVLLNMANGVYQNTVYGMAAKLPIKYTGVVVLGSNISGLFVSIASIISTSVAPSHRTAAIYYFIIAIFILLACFDTYFALPLNKFYRYNEMLNEKEAGKHKTDDARPPYWTIFKQCSPQLFNIFFIFFITLSLFPAVYSGIQVNDPENFIISEKLFTSITCFLTFNLFAMLGSLLTSWIKWPSPKYLVYPVVLRVIFIPLFLFCNYQLDNNKRKMSVLITNDYVYWIIASLMSFSSGYLSSLGMMYAPQLVTPKYALTAGMFAAAMLITGITVGVLFANVFPMLVEAINW